MVVPDLHRRRKKGKNGVNENDRTIVSCRRLDDIDSQREHTSLTPNCMLVLTHLPKGCNSFILHRVRNSLHDSHIIDLHPALY